MTLLEWQAGNGWLVFSGGADAGGTVRGLAISRADADGAVVYVSLADDGGDALLEDMEDLGARTGYMVDIIHESPDIAHEQIKDASLVVLEGGDSLAPLVEAMTPPIQQALQEAYANGAVILVEGLAVNLFGRWMIDDFGNIMDGLHWVRNAFLEPRVTSAEESRAVQDILAAEPEAIAIEIGEESALALGAGGRIELWGQRQVTISLGQFYQQDGE